MTNTSPTAEEPHRRSADGDWDALQQGTAAWQSILQRVVREFAGCAWLGGGTAQAEAGTVGVLRCDPAAIAQGAKRASGSQRAGDAIAEHPRCGRDHGVELGPGSWRSGPACFDCAGGQLLRADQRPAQFGWQGTTRADFHVLKQSIGIEQVLASYRVELKRAGHNQLRGPCPLPTHGSARSLQSFSVDTAKNVWACHANSCCEVRQGRVGGNVLDLMALLEGCTIRDAALRLRDGGCC